MEPDRWRRIERLYHGALEKEPAQRNAYLVAACGSDQTLLLEVESLLAQEKHAREFIEEPAFQVVARDMASEPSQLAVGQEFGRYRILSLIGAGGMGAVYTAHDSRLGRTVALKFLPAEFLSEREALDRFSREARALSALNHPNICTIYDTEEAAGRVFIAMEYVSGKRLDQHIGRDGLLLKEALQYALQIADALATAHGSGVIHRDLKPGNIVIRDDGIVKLLDFGLAKLSTSGSDHHPSADPEVSRSSKAIVGTAAYMSPEQAAGKRVDARSDIFAFGAVLYEMLTGRRPFPGESSVSILSSVLHLDPTPVASIRAGLPPEVETLVVRCLRKDPERRFQCARDVRVSIREIVEDLESAKPAPGAPSPPKSRFAVAALILAAAILLAAGLVWRFRIPAQAPRPHLVITRLTTDPGLTTSPAISPDGKLVAYASDRGGGDNLDIWVQQVAGGAASRLTTNPADDTAPDFSPDGSRIAFFSARDGGGIYVVPAIGGEERLVARNGAWTSRPRLSPDGNWIAYSIGAPIGYARMYVVSSVSGQPQELKLQIPWAGYPIWSPDGKRLLFVGSTSPSGRPPFDWWIVPVEGGAAVKTGASGLIESNGLQLVSGKLNGPASWKGNRILFYAHSGNTSNLWRLTIDPNTWQANGLERLTTGADREVDPSVSSDGRLVFATTDERLNLWTLPMDARNGKTTGLPQPLTQSAAGNARPSLSADGRKLVFESARSGNVDVWIRDMATGAERALTATPWNETHPAITADGSKVVYASAAGAKPEIYVQSTAGGVAEKICEDCGTPMGWSPDGRSIFYYYWQTASRYGSIIQASRERSDLIHHQYNLHMMRYFPDGKWLTFHMPVVLTEGRSALFIAPFRDGVVAGEEEWIRITDGAGIDATPWSSPDGSILYFLSKRDGFQCIWAQRLDSRIKRPLGTPFAVAHFHGARYRLQEPGFGPGIGADKLVFTMSDTTGNIWMTKVEP
jgi:Tol biopolymer transport system component